LEFLKNCFGGLGDFRVGTLGRFLEKRLGGFTGFEEKFLCLVALVETLAA
jgi:hypothetical protein